MPAEPDITIETTARIWKQIVFRKRNAAAAVAAGELSLSGGLGDVVSFLRLFER